MRARQRALMLCRTWYAQPCELTGKRITVAGIGWALNYAERGTPDYPPTSAIPSTRRSFRGANDPRAGLWGVSPLGLVAPPLILREDRLRLVEQDAYRLLVGKLRRPPGIPTLACEVVSRFARADTRAAERAVERLFDEAQRYEYVNRGHADELGRRDLPAPGGS